MAAACALALAAPLAWGDAAPDEHPGRLIYTLHCLECHGERGQGVEGVYEDVLEGDRSVESLARRIERTMPEEEPGLVVGEEARLVAEWIHAAFYSAEARARLGPPATDLTRLTAEQHQRSLVDIVDRLGRGTPAPTGSERGLRAEIFATHQFNGDKNRPEGGRFQRTDATISFDFGDGSPREEVIGKDEFSIRWQGVIVPEESGTHEFNVVTRNGVRLWVNDEKLPLVDGWVSSGAEPRSERGAIYLVAGRPYPLKLEFFSYKESAASVELRWRPPHGVDELVPPHVLAPSRSHKALAIEVGFPADDSSDGYPRGKTISSDWYRATVEAATATAHVILARADELAGTTEGAPDRVDRWRALAAELAAIAFRRPPDDAWRAELDGIFAANEDPAEALKRAVIRILTAPWFLYPEACHSEPDGHTVAARLALFLWDSVPDAELACAAADGRLGDPAEAARQIRRMMQDPRTRVKLDGFFHHWLELGHGGELFKDPERYPAFDARIVADLRRSLRHFIEHVVWDDRSDYRRLLLADELWLNRRLAGIYAPDLLEPRDGADPLPADAFIAVRLDPRRHSGLVSHPFLLATHAYHHDTSPIHRGVFLAQNLAGRPLRPPPVETVFEDSHFDPGLSMREKVAEMTKDSTCMACHTLINPLGFSLEHYDSIGRWRAADHHGRPIDSASDYTTDEGETIRLAGARDVAAYAAASDLAHRAFLRALFHHLVKQPVEAYGHDRMDHLHARFQGTGFRITGAIETIALTAAAVGVFDPPAPDGSGTP